MTTESIQPIIGILPSGYNMRLTSVTGRWSESAIQVKVFGTKHGMVRSENIPYRSLFPVAGSAFHDVVLPVARRLASEMETERMVYEGMGV